MLDHPADHPNPSPITDFIAAIVVFDQHGHTVLQLRDDKPTITNPNCWGLFGGRIEQGETWVEAAAREVGEELTLPATASDLTWLGQYDVRPGCVFHTFTYRAGPLVDRATLTEGQAFRRFTIDELRRAVTDGSFGGHAMSDSAQIVLQAYLRLGSAALEMTQ